MPSSSPAKPAAAAPEPGEDALVTQLKLFASYSPAEVVMRYVNHPSPAPPSVEEEEKFEGAIGFVDVSGFTALSEKLNKDHGRKGAELLNQCVSCPQALTSKELPAQPPCLPAAQRTAP